MVRIIYNNIMLYGNTDGIKKTTLEELEALLGSYDKSCFIDRAVLETTARISFRLNREISLFISRNGRLLEIGRASCRERV